MASEAFDKLHEAITNKKVVIAVYKGHRRKMCPHVLGWKNGREHCLLYQFAGGSSTGIEPDGSPHNWRCVFVNQLSHVEVADGEWRTAPNHSRPQTCVDQIAIEVTH